MTHRYHYLTLLPFTVGMLAACPAQHVDTGDEILAEATIGPEGGTLSAPDFGLELHVPPGALDEATKLTVSLGPEPDGYVLAAPVFHFEPEGLQLALPAEVVLVIAGSIPATLFWTQPDGGGFEPISEPGVGEVHGTTDHFGDLVPGADCHGSDEPAECKCVNTTDDLANGGVLCQENPGAGDTPCPEGADVIVGYEPGETCSGVGLWPKLDEWCLCLGNSTGNQLCPVPQDPPFDQACPENASNPQGFSGYMGPAMSSCFGYYVATDANGDEYPQGESGETSGCALERNGSEWSPAQGTADCGGAKPPVCSTGYDN